MILLFSVKNDQSFLFLKILKLKLSVKNEAAFQQHSAAILCSFCDRFTTIDRAPRGPVIILIDRVESLPRLLH